jgi:hypothetical protein
MPLYTVFAPPLKPNESQPDPLRLVFVKDGFCWPALFVPVVWLAYRRLWLWLAVYIVAAIGLGALSDTLGGPLPGLTMVLAHFLFALEGNTLRRNKLVAKGYSFVGVVEGRRRDVELRFFSQYEPPILMPPPAATDQPPPAPPRALPPPEPARASVEAGEVVGLFPAPGGAR